jgi:hypothetical protein
MSQPNNAFEAPAPGEKWMSPETAAQVQAAEEKMLQAWARFIDTVGPAYVKAYRAGLLDRQPHELLFERVKEPMYQYALKALIQEELRQDKEEGQV